MNKNVRKITEGALMCALVGLCLVLDRQTAGFFTVYITFLIPLPLLVYTAKYGMKYAAVVYVALTLIATFISLPQTALYVALCGLSGMVYGEGVRKGKSNLWLFSSLVAITSVMYLITTILLASFFGYDLQREIATLAISIHEVIPFISMETVESVSMVLVPIITFLTAFLESFLVHVLANFLLRRLKIKVPALPSLYYVRGSMWQGIVLIGIIGLNFIMPHFEVSQNILDFILAIAIIAMIILAIYGVIVILLISTVYKMKYVSLILIIGIFVLLPVMSLIGVIDCFTDIRERITKRGPYEKRI